MKPETDADTAQAVRAAAARITGREFCTGCRRQVLLGQMARMQPPRMCKRCASRREAALAARQQRMK